MKRIRVRKFQFCNLKISSSQTRLFKLTDKQPVGAKQQQQQRRRQQTGPHLWFSFGTRFRRFLVAGSEDRFFCHQRSFVTASQFLCRVFPTLPGRRSCGVRHTQLFVRFVGQSPRFAVPAAAWFLCCYTGRFVCVARRQVMCRSGTCCAGYEESEGRCHIVEAGAASSSSSAVLWAACGCLQS